MAVKLSDYRFQRTVYQASNAPRYLTGNSVLLAICAVCLILYTLTYAFYQNVNKTRLDLRFAT